VVIWIITVSQHSRPMTNAILLQIPLKILVTLLQNNKSHGSNNYWLIIKNLLHLISQTKLLFSTRREHMHARIYDAHTHIRTHRNTAITKKITASNYIRNFNGGKLELTKNLRTLNCMINIRILFHQWSKVDDENHLQDVWATL